MAVSRYSHVLLPHERALLAEDLLHDVTHDASSSIWLHADSIQLGSDGQLTTLYRPMGDAELLFLLKENQLPDTQPYQAVMEGPDGRTYAEKYLSGAKRVDTSPTTVVEFVVPRQLVEILRKIQCKIEDGVMSMGLGSKAGRGLPLFNAYLSENPSAWRIVKVKRKYPKKK